MTYDDNAAPAPRVSALAHIPDHARATLAMGILDMIEAGILEVVAYSDDGNHTFRLTEKGKKGLSPSLD